MMNPYAIITCEVNYMNDYGCGSESLIVITIPDYRIVAKTTISFRFVIKMVIRVKLILVS